MAYRKINKKKAETTPVTYPEMSLETVSKVLEEKPVPVEYRTVLSITHDDMRLINYLHDNGVNIYDKFDFATYGINNGQYKIQQILKIISETFSTENNDGIKIPVKFTFWWALLNFSKIIKMIEQIINVLKEDIDNKKVIQLKYG